MYFSYKTKRYSSWKFNFPRRKGVTFNTTGNSEDVQADLQDFRSLSNRVDTIHGVNVDGSQSNVP